MKNLVYLIFVLSIFSSCIKNKSVIEPLDEDDVIALIEKDSLYEGVIKSIELIREEFTVDIVLRSRFKDFSYKDYLDYRKKVTDSIFLKSVDQKADNKFIIYTDSLFRLYKNKIDSVKSYWHQEYKKKDPANYFSVSFLGYVSEYISTTGLSYLNHSSYIKFKIKPVLPFQQLQGGEFSYSVTPKVSTSSLNGWNQCYFSSPNLDSWDVPYSIDRAFKRLGNKTIISDYNFDYVIHSVRIDDRTYTLDNINIPKEYKDMINLEKLNNEEYLDLISYQYDLLNLSLVHFYQKILIEEKRKINKTARQLEELISQIE